MRTGNSKGDCTGPPGEQKNVNILLVGSGVADTDLMKKELGLIRGHTYAAWYCADLEEAMDFIGDDKCKIEIIFLDLSLFNADYPKERFLQVRKNIPDIPIIVLTDRTDYDLIHFVMEAGAADTLSRWQIRSDPDRLRNVVESCLSRDKIAKGKWHATMDSFQNPASVSAEAFRQQRHKSDALLRHVQKQAAFSLKIVNDENTQLRRDASNAIANLLKARHEGAADLQQAHDRSNVILKRVQEENKAALLVSRDENAQLRRDLDKSDTELQKAHTKSDAILKDVQNRGRHNLKEAKDEIRELRNELNHAKEWLSGSYSILPKGEHED